MSQSAYISLVQGSAAAEISLEDVKQQLQHYREQTGLTGQQLDWNYAEAAFPYSIETKAGEEDRWFFLKGRKPPYRYILFGTGLRAEGETTVPYIHVVLPDDATHGDKSKANEYCKWIGKRLLAEVKLFNGRTLYYNPRK
ncbi:DUF1885 domain-containing protein [Cohnella lubricantis]|uniref:DUF1885 family protein n=1 Tax=Cohnella lubricantis TaxID=2163172 RepID=A0A841TB61_9BACL|nr:DUF1885 family protein [Cohnella lubricantis]MBB6677265.1 DUF1885 family protein [Cohnella lubricantis]MBP2116924.1 hypothetical protein [Cohnella lubricantis]